VEMNIVFVLSDVRLLLQFYRNGIWEKGDLMPESMMVETKQLQIVRVIIATGGNMCNMMHL